MEEPPNEDSDLALAGCDEPLFSAADSTEPLAVETPGVSVPLVREPEKGFKCASWLRAASKVVALRGELEAEIERG